MEYPHWKISLSKNNLGQDISTRKNSPDERDSFKIFDWLRAKIQFI